MERCPGKMSGKDVRERERRGRRKKEGGGRGEKKEDEREGVVEKEGGAESRQNEEKENGGDMEIDNMFFSKSINV